MESLLPFRLFTGHINLKVWESLPFRPTFLVLLRHPIERIESEYFFLRSGDPNHPWLIENPDSQFARQVGLAKQMTLLEFVSSHDPALEGQLSNSQARQLTCGVDDQFPGSEEDLFRAAREQLDKLDFVGVTEQADLFQMMVTQKLEWPLPETPFRENTFESEQATSGKIRLERAPLPPRDVARVIWDRNQIDVRVYYHARKLFAKQAFEVLSEAVRTG